MESYTKVIHSERVRLGLSPLEYFILDSVIYYSENGNGCDMSLSNMAKLFGYSKSQIKRALSELKKKGYLNRIDGKLFTSFRWAQNEPRRKMSRAQNEPTGRRKMSPLLGAKRATIKDKRNNKLNNIKKASQKKAGKKTTKEEFLGIIELYNEVCGQFMPKVIGGHERRKKLVDARLHEHGPESVLKALKMASESKLLTGQKSKRDWRASFDWIFKKENMIKILEGNYTDGPIEKTVQGIPEKVIESYANIFNN